MTLSEALDYIQSKNNNIEIVGNNRYDIGGLECRLDNHRFCIGYRGNNEIVFYRCTVFNHKVDSTYNGNWNCSYLTFKKIDEMFDKFMKTYQEASMDLKEIIIDEKLEDVKKDFK